MATFIAGRIAAFALSAALVSAQTATDVSSPGRGPDRGRQASVVSIDLLRHPISGKARKMLQMALRDARSGDHESSITQLKETLARFPDSAAYVHSLLGVEYVRTGRFAKRRWFRLSKPHLCYLTMR